MTDANEIVSTIERLLAKLNAFEQDPGPPRYTELWPRARVEEHCRNMRTLVRMEIYQALCAHEAARRGPRLERGPESDQGPLTIAKLDAIMGDFPPGDLLCLDD